MGAAQDIAALRTRWQLFLDRIEAAHGETLDGAEEALVGLILDPGGGVQPFTIALHAVMRQLQDLGRKVEQTWEQSVGPKMRAADPDEEHWDHLVESARGDELDERLRLTRERRERIIAGTAAEKVLEAALSSAGAAFRCSNCSADLRVTTNPFLAHYETCPYCNGISTFHPSTDMREVNWFAVDRLAALRTLDLWDALQAAYARYWAHRRPVPQEALADLRAHHDAYHVAYLRERIRLVPELEVSYREDLERYRTELATIGGRST